MFGLIRYFTHTIRRRYVTESGAFQSLKRPIEVRKLLLFLGVPLAAKIGYDLAVLQDEWRQFDELRAEPGVTIWNKYVVRELRRALDDPRVQAALGHDVTEDAGKTMKENTRTTWRFFRHWRIIELEGVRELRVPLKGSSGTGALVVDADRRTGDWQLVRAYVEKDVDDINIPLL